MSKFSNSVIGPHSRQQLKSSSPYATLLLDIGHNLCQDDVSSLKLLLQVDKFVKRFHLGKLKNGQEILSHMYGTQLISETDTQFLEQLLTQIGRKDLLKRIERYHSKRLNITDDKKLNFHVPDTTNTENTVPKCLYEVSDSESIVSSSTGPGVFDKTQVDGKLKEKTVEKDSKQGESEFTVLKTPFSHINQQAPCIQESSFSILGERSVPDGQSVPNSGRLDIASGSSRRLNTASMSPGSLDMDVRLDPSNGCPVDGWDIEMTSQRSSQGSQESQMSISDDEKLGLYHDKALLTDGDSSLSNMQLSQD